MLVGDGGGEATDGEVVEGRRMEWSGEKGVEVGECANKGGLCWNYLQQQRRLCFARRKSVLF